MNLRELVTKVFESVGENYSRLVYVHLRRRTGEDPLKLLSEKPATFFKTYRDVFGDASFKLMANMLSGVLKTQGIQVSGPELSVILLDEKLLQAFTREGTIKGVLRHVKYDMGGLLICLSDLEKEIARFYSILAQSSRDRSVKTVFEFIAGESGIHSKLMKNLAAYLRPAEKYDCLEIFGSSIKNIMSTVKEVKNKYSKKELKREEIARIAPFLVEIEEVIELHIIGIFDQLAKTKKETIPVLVLKFKEILRKEEERHIELIKTVSEL